jgi:hypothetical protein
VFWTEWIRSACWWGLGAFLTLEDETGQPLAGSLRLVDSRLLWTQRDAGGALHWVLGTGDSFGEDAVFDRDGYLALGAIRYRIVVLRNPHSPIDAEGMSQGVFALSPAAFRLSGQVDSYASGTFRSGIPAGYLKVQTPGLGQEQATELKTRWMAAHGGDRRSIAVLNATTEFVPLNLTPVDAALGEVKRLSIADVAYAFGLSPETLGVTMANSATYQNIREAWLNHRDFGLAPWIAAVEDTLSALLPGTQAVKVNIDGFASPPAAERFASYKVAIDSGVLTVDECRELEGLPPLPDQPQPPELEVVEPEEETPTRSAHAPSWLRPRVVGR